MLRNVRDDDAWPGKQRCFQAQRRLVMQGIFPPVGHHKFRQNHCQDLIRMQFVHRVLFSVIVTRFPLIVSEQASEEALEGEICLGRK